MKEQATAKLRHLRMGPRKIRLLVDLIRGLKVEDAIVQLENNHKHAARPVLKLLRSAMANAKENYSLKEETLVIKTIFVDDAATLHRWMPKAMGRATPIRKRGSHLTIILEGEVDEKKKKIAKAEKKVVKKSVVESKENFEDKKEVSEVDNKIELENTKKPISKTDKNENAKSFFQKSALKKKLHKSQER